MITIGTDIVDVARVRDKQAAVVTRILSAQEQAYCQSQADPSQHIAGRFAAKEAVFKALHAPSPNGISWLDIDVHNDAHGVPHATLRGAAAAFATQQGLRGLYISIAHVRDFATATAVCEWPDKT
jgi:holo-[acyl-carrier protein] synthase